MLSKPLFLGDAGSTKIETMEDSYLKESWEKTDIWPTNAEQAILASGPWGDIKHFLRFCPDVSFERFGPFAADLHKYADEIDVGNAHKVLRRERASPDQLAFELVAYRADALFRMSAILTCKNWER
jgi:hypothetical protein